MFSVDVPMTLADSWQAYKALLDGIAEWGGKTSNVGINPEQPRTWIGHVPTLDAVLPGRWQRYVQDASLAAKDQLSFRNHVILALAAEKTRSLALVNAPVAKFATQLQPTSQAKQVTFASAPMQQQQPVQQFNTPLPQYGSPGSTNRADQLLNEARGYRRVNKWALAKDAYSQVLAIQPGNPEAKEGLNVATQKASMRMLAIVMPIMCGGMIAFILIFLGLVLNM
jgi:hypothetical protein